MRSLIILLAFCAGVTRAWFWSGPPWDGLQVKWGFNVWDKYTYNKPPLTEKDAIAAGFKKIGDCDTSSLFKGSRYISDDDYALVVIYDILGSIAGLQSGIKVNATSKFPGPVISGTFVLKEGQYHFATVYFVDPITICKTGRRAEEVAEQGTGTNLYIQNSPNPDTCLLVPYYQDKLENTIWTEGVCFVSMGKHYWYNLTPDMACENIVPFFLLYDSGEMVGFGFAFTTYAESPRFEHPPKDSYPKFMKTPPTCLATAGTMTTMHVYLSTSWKSDMCIFR